MSCSYFFFCGETFLILRGRSWKLGESDIVESAKVWRVESAASFRVVLDKEGASRASIEVSKYLVSWFRTYLGDLQPT